MKKILAKFANNLLSKQQMKSVKGGYGLCIICSSGGPGNGSGACSPPITCSEAMRIFDMVAGTDSYNYQVTAV